MAVPPAVGAATAGETTGNAAPFARRIPDVPSHTLVARGPLAPDPPLPPHDRVRPGAHP
ncbi:hypothetical protein [Streptomyces kronopolitis]|uniref:hypothetical protein n=1 Tax=Streptomyces kronopolitis TaxID=1612435 RepID=UPI00344627D0